jgi:uncharacterized protein YceH (UPF0502 family)
MILDPVQVRVLGALIEKEIVTPENYPLSLNALVAACNQKSSRDPVMELAEDEVRQALHLLEDQGLASVVRDSRVPKYEHRIRTVLNLRRDETAILCLLLLRGPQTPGELRSRGGRMYSFDGLDAVESTLSRLASDSTDSEGSSTAGDVRPLVAVLPRQPGSREARYAHLLGGPVASLPHGSSFAGTGPQAPVESIPRALTEDRISRLEAEVASLRERMAQIETNLRSGLPGREVVTRDTSSE